MAVEAPAHTEGLHLRDRLHLVDAAVAGDAADAGLEPGDVITAINGKEVKSKEDVGSVVRASKPGEKIEVTYIRNGEEHTGTAELGRRGN